mmetsp:Transcript_4797/g.6973  ORF Transcript_4797/g.6973 Transcript_4797/m.6973 type:complete len:1061 (-) Transcript_4797:444-3626(-)
MNQWQTDYKQPHFVTTFSPGANNLTRANGTVNYTKSTAARLSSIELQYLVKAGILEGNQTCDSDGSDDSSVLVYILVAKLDPDRSMLTFEIIGYENNYAHTALDSLVEGAAKVYCSKTFFWPSYVENKLSDLGFVRGKDENYTDGDSAGVDRMLGMLGLLNFTGVEDRVELFDNNARSDQEQGKISPLRIYLLSAQGGLWMYDPLVFFTQQEKKHDLFEDLLLFAEEDDETGFSDNLISNFDAIWAGSLSVAELNLDKPIKHQFAQIYSTSLRVHSEYCIIYGTGRLLLTNKTNIEHVSKKKRKQKSRDVASFVLYLSCVNDVPKERIMNIYPNKVVHVVVPLFHQRENLVLFEKQESKSRWANIYNAPHHKLCLSDDQGSIYFHTGGESLSCPIETKGIQPCYILPAHEMRRKDYGVKIEKATLQAGSIDKFETSASMIGKGQFRHTFSRAQPVILFHSKSFSLYSIFSLRETTQPRHVFSFLTEYQDYQTIMHLVDILWEREEYNLVDGDSRFSFKATKNSTLIDSGVAATKGGTIFKKELIQIYLQSYISFVASAGQFLEDSRFHRLQFYLTSDFVASDTISYLLGSAIMLYEVCFTSLICNHFDFVKQSLASQRLFTFSKTKNQERKYNFQVHLMDIFLYSLSRGSKNRLFHDFLPIIVHYMPLSFGIETSNSQAANLVEESIQLVVKYDLISEYLQYCWGSLETSMRYGIIFIADDKQSSFPFLQYSIVHDWILDQLEAYICDQSTTANTEVLLKLVSCITGQQVIEVQNIADTEGIICANKSLKAHLESSQQSINLCQASHSSWDHDLLLTALLLLTSRNCIGDFGIVLSRERTDNSSSDGDTSSEICFIPAETLLCTLGSILTPRSEYTLFGLGHEEFLRYVNFQRVLKYCHQLENVYIAGVIMDKLELILIGILKNCGVGWTIEKCWQVLTHGNDDPSKDSAEYLQYQVRKKPLSLSRYHLHLLAMMQSNNDPQELKLILRAVLLLNLQDFVNLGCGENGAYILQIILFDDEFSPVCDSYFDLKDMLELAQRYCGFTECLPEHVVAEIINGL